MEELNIATNKYLLPLVSFIINLGFGMISPIMIYYLMALDKMLTTLPEELGTIENAGAVAFEYTLMMASFMLTRALLARYFGDLSDRIGRKKIILFGLLGYTILSYLYILAQNWIHLLIIRAIQGVSSAMVWPVAEALLIDSVPQEERGRWMGIYISSMFASFIAGPALGVASYKYAAYVLNYDVLNALKFPFYILTLMSLASFLLSFILRETISLKKKKIDIEKMKRARMEILNKLPPKIKKAVNVLYIMGFANGIAMGFVAPIMNIFITQYITADPTVLGIIASISGGLGIAVSYSAGRISDKVGRKKMVISGQLISRTMTMITPLIKDVDELLIVVSLRVAAFNISSPAYRALQGDLVPKQIRGRVFGTVQTLFNFGAALSPLGGYIYQLLSKDTIYLISIQVPAVAVLFWMSALIGFITVMLFALYVPEPNDEERRIIESLERSFISLR